MLDTVEINGSFYRLPPRAWVERWAAAVPEDFVFAIKAWRGITHHRRLEACGDLIGRLLEAVAPLGPKAGPILFQLPASLHPDPALLDAFLADLPPGHRYAFEFRDERWHTDATLRCLERAGAAFCCFEFGKLRSPRAVTADFVYVRLHGRERPYYGAYGTASLEVWAAWLRDRLAEGRDAYIYLDNTALADDAVRNARELKALVGG